VGYVGSTGDFKGAKWRWRSGRRESALSSRHLALDFMVVVCMVQCQLYNPEVDLSVYIHLPFSCKFRSRLSAFTFSILRRAMVSRSLGEDPSRFCNFFSQCRRLLYRLVDRARISACSSSWVIPGCAFTKEATAAKAVIKIVKRNIG
jgi:hypothetical protein